MFGEKFDLTFAKSTPFFNLLSNAPLAHELHVNIKLLAYNFVAIIIQNILMMQLFIDFQLFLKVKNVENKPVICTRIKFTVDK